MKLIDRPNYLNKLIKTIGTPDIKIITGIRRSGKSKLLELFINYVKETNKDANIIQVNYNLSTFKNIKDADSLEEYVLKHYDAKKDNFVLIDEIQMCDGFESAINSLHASEKFDIYLTGSNAFLLSSDLATLFTGRTIEISVFPFSFKEFLSYFPSYTNVDEAFHDYVLFGGMAGSYPYVDLNMKYDYIKGIYDTLILRDIKEKYNLRYPLLLDRITEYLLDNISNITSIRNISNTLTNNQDKINHKTVGKYLDYLCNAFAFYKVRRYDINGKKYLTTSDKYYLADHAFRFAVLGSKNLDYGRIYENIVAIELLRRGYEIYVGVLYKKEIDFVAINRDEKIYIQVSDDISSDKTFKREVDSLLKINDAYPKILLANTHHDTYTYEGVKIIDIARWLSE